MTTTMATSVDARLINIAQLEKITASLQQKPFPLGLDLETTGLDPRHNKIVSLMFGTTRQVYVLDMRPFYSVNAVEKQRWVESIACFLQSAPMFVGHNLKFDWSFLYHAVGARINCVVDTMLQEQVLYGGLLEEYDEEDDESLDVPVVKEHFFRLDVVASRYGLTAEKDDREWFYKPLPLDQRPAEWDAPFPERILRYMGQDIIIPMSLYQAQQERLEAKGLLPAAQLENEVLPAFASMECAGCPIDAAHWRSVLQLKQIESEKLSVSIMGRLQVGLVEVQRQKNEEREATYVEALRVYNEELVQWDQLKAHYMEQVGQEYKAAFERGIPVPSFGVYQKNKLAQWVKGTKKPAKPAKPVLYEVTKLTQTAAVALALYELGCENMIKVKGTTEKRPSTNKFVLARVLENKNLDVGIRNMIVDFQAWRTLDTTLKSFGEKLLQKIDPLDGRIHPTYNQLGTVTGRVSCRNPNWQQLPSHENKLPKEQRIRSCVVARPGYVMVDADLPNIELRILAELASDENMLAAFASGLDLHSTTATLMFNLEIPTLEELYKLVEVNVDIKEQMHGREGGIDVQDVIARTTKIGSHTARDIAKTINFGLMYGMSPARLSATLKVTHEEAERLFDIYRSAYPTAWDYLERNAKAGVALGYSKTILGRKRFYKVPKMPTQNEYRTWKEYSHALWAYENVYIPRIERQSKNAPIQGSNADVTKKAMIMLYQQLPEDSYLIAVIHDEALVECPESKKDEVAAIVSECMYNACKAFLKVVNIPPIDTKIGAYWMK